MVLAAIVALIVMGYNDSRFVQRVNQSRYFAFTTTVPCMRGCSSSP